MIEGNCFKEKLSGIHYTIGYINPLEKEYQPILAVKAFHQLLKRHSTWRMKVVGFGQQYVGLQTYIKENDLGCKIMLYGPLSPQEIYDVFKRVDIVVVPSEFIDDKDMTKDISALGAPMVIHEGHQINRDNNINQAFIYHDGSVDNLVDKLELAVNTIESFDNGFIRNHRLNGVFN